MKAVVALRELTPNIQDADVVKLFKDLTFQQEHRFTWASVMHNLHGISVEDAMSQCDDPIFSTFYKFVKNTVARELNEREIDFAEIGYYHPDSGRSIFGLSMLLSKSLIRADQAKSLLKDVFKPENTSIELEELILRSDVLEGGDSSELDEAIKTVLTANQKIVDEFRAGKDKALNSLMGQVMKIVKGNPQEILAKMKEQIK